LPSDSGDDFAFILLLRDAAGAGSLAQYLDGARPATGGAAARFVIPPVRGLDFFAEEGSQAELDRWWASSVPGTASPVYVLMHEDGLAGWLAGLDGSFYIGVAGVGMEAAEYSRVSNAHAVVTDGLLGFANALLADFAAPPRHVFDRGEEQRLGALSESLSPPQEPRPPDPFRSLSAPPADPLDPPPPSPPGAHHSAMEQVADPFDLVMSAQPQRQEPIAAAGLSDSELAGAGWPRQVAGPIRRAGRSPWSRRGPFAAGPMRELAAAMVERGPTIAVIGSRKGGVGKTSHAAGVAIVAGEVLDLIGHRAAIVDANIANPDAWGQLNLPDGAATVRQVVAALTAGREPPPPVHAASPALACYPESREAGDYSRTDVDRLAAYLRRRYTFVVVDMSNRLPDPLAGPEAAAAAYWLEHGDVLVLPTASSKQDFNGVLDYLEVRHRPPTVVPYIVPADRRNRDHPVARQYLDAIGRRVQRIVPIPDEADKVRYAGMEGVSVQQVSSNLRGAYRELMEAVVRVPLRRQG